MRRFVLIVLMALFAGSMSAQQLSNVDAEQQNKKAVITYDFAAKAGVSDYDIKLYVSTDGGRTWQQVLNGLSGDIGKISSSGHKTIVWDVLADRDKLQGEDIRFKVTASFNDFGNYTETAGGVNIDMVAIKGGTYAMGDNFGDGQSDEMPVHDVTLSDFYIGKTEVTFEQYDAFCNATGREKPDDEGWGRGTRPVNNVSWDDATAYCEWLSQKTGKTYRLPTEAEWEYAARGGNNSNGYRYSGSNDPGSVAWYYDNTGSKTHPVAQKLPNESGLYDMSGNVWEWCSDWYGDYPSSAQTNPQGPSSGAYRVYRGGSWFSYAQTCRTACRSGYTPTYRRNLLGFRVVSSQVQ